MKLGNSFLQAVFRRVRPIISAASRKMQRDTAVLTVGVAVVTAAAFAASVYQGGSRNSLVVFAETHQGTGEEGTKAEDHKTLEAAGAAEAWPRGIKREKTAPQAVMPKNEGAEPQQMAEDTAKEPEQENGGNDAGKEEPKAVSAQGLAYSDQDYQVLLKIVQAEAGNCDMKGRILVANVILNRVRSGEFPDSITGVVYEKSQFSPVSNGMIRTCSVTQETVNAVNRALSGEDYSQGALYFMNRNGSTGKNISWFDNHLSYLFKHGNHEFFK